VNLPDGVEPSLAELARGIEVSALKQDAIVCHRRRPQGTQDAEVGPKPGVFSTIQQSVSSAAVVAFSARVRRFILAPTEQAQRPTCEAFAVRVSSVDIGYLLSVSRFGLSDTHGYKKKKPPRGGPLRDAC
jgi:hypothetical protein